MNRIIIALLALIAIVVIAGCVSEEPEPEPEPRNFEECVNAGYPVMESYPRQCMANGKTFVEELCGIENCHGLEIICGSNIPAACTGEYVLGDKCRKFASCEDIDGECQLVTDGNFEECKTCVEKCLEDFGDSGNEIFECENSCGQTQQEYCTDKETGQRMSLETARLLARGGGCKQEGEFLDTYTCNEETGTWWLDMNPYEEKEGCNPACVVSMDYGTAIINWRCTGLLPD